MKELYTAKSEAPLISYPIQSSIFLFGREDPPASKEAPLDLLFSHKSDHNLSLPPCFFVAGYCLLKFWHICWLSHACLGLNPIFTWNGSFLVFVDSWLKSQPWSLRWSTRAHQVPQCSCLFQKKLHAITVFLILFYLWLMCPRKRSCSKCAESHSGWEPEP